MRTAEKYAAVIAESIMKRIKKRYPGTPGGGKVADMASDFLYNNGVNQWEVRSHLAGLCRNTIGSGQPEMYMKIYTERYGWLMKLRDEFLYETRLAEIPADYMIDRMGRIDMFGYPVRDLAGAYEYSMEGARISEGLSRGLVRESFDDPYVRNTVRRMNIGRGGSPMDYPYGIEDVNPLIDRKTMHIRRDGNYDLSKGPTKRNMFGFPEASYLEGMPDPDADYEEVQGPVYRVFNGAADSGRHIGKIIDRNRNFNDRVPYYTKDGMLDLRNIENSAYDRLMNHRMRRGMKKVRGGK